MTDQRDNPGTIRESGPDTIAQYELLTKFATGGMAELFLARELGVAGLERVVVIKRLLPHLADDPESVDMFLREARLVARLNHPNVVQTYELGEEDGEYFLAMEYLHGSTLRELQGLADDRGEGLPLEIAVSSIDQAARGLHAAHELRDFEGNLVELIHRDVSPQNLMVTEEGYVKLLDFGVAKAAEGKEATQSGNLKGKFSYMSPEQLHREELDRRSDIFALGVVLWELMTGERLFDRDGELETMQAITEESVPPPSSRNAAIPDPLDAVVIRALAKDREQRYQTAEQLRQDLVEVGEGRDLLVGEHEIADYLQEVAGEQLEARRETLQEALERSLTAGERARLRHEEGAYDSANRQFGSGVEDATEIERPLPESTPTGGSDHGAAPGAHAPAGSATPTAHAPTEDSESADSGVPWQFGLLGAAVVLLAASGLLIFWGGSDETEGADAGEGATSPRPPEVSGEPLEFGVAPIATEDVLRPEFAPIERYLERRTGRPINIVVASSYENTSQRLRDGDFDFAMLTPLLFVRTRRADPSIQPLAVREFDGSVRSDGLLLVLGDSEFGSLEDLEGETFCFTDKNSTTGNFLPRAYLRDQGHDPESFIGTVHWSGNHLQGLKDLVAGECAAAATYSGSFITADEHGLPVGQIRTLAITGHTPSDTFTARPGLSQEMVDQLREALLEFDPEKHADTGAIGTTLRLTGFREPSAEIYESLETAVDRHADILEKFGFPGMVPRSDGPPDDAGSPSRDASDATDRPRPP